MNLTQSAQLNIGYSSRCDLRWVNIVVAEKKQNRNYF